MAFILRNNDFVRRSRELYHYGIKGQKWGIRRFQNEDGSLTTLGRQHYYPNSSKTIDERWKANEEAHRKNSAAATQRLASGTVGYYKKSKDASKNYWGGLKDIRQENKRYRKEKKELKKLKKANELSRKSSDTKRAVKAYQKEYERIVGKANRQYQKNYETVSNNWNSIGKSEFRRSMKAKFKRNDPSVVAWRDSVNKMVNDSRKAQQEWKDSNVKELYMQTGSNAISRVINNIKYDTLRKKK